MPKLKTHKGLKKRVRLTKTGKIKRTKSGKSHILTKKSRKRKRSLRNAAIMVTGKLHSNLKRLLPYG